MEIYRSLKSTYSELQFNAEGDSFDKIDGSGSMGAERNSVQVH